MNWQRRFSQLQSYSRISGSPLAHLQALAASARYERRLTFSLLLSRTHEGPKAMEIDDIVKAAEEIASGRKGPQYIIKVIRSKL
jgi:hypothetical protein